MEFLWGATGIVLIELSAKYAEGPYGILLGFIGGIIIGILALRARNYRLLETEILKELAKLNKEEEK